MYWCGSLSLVCLQMCTLLLHTPFSQGGMPGPSHAPDCCQYLAETHCNRSPGDVLLLVRARTLALVNACFFLAAAQKCWLRDDTANYIFVRAKIRLVHLSVWLYIRSYPASPSQPVSHWSVCKCSFRKNGFHVSFGNFADTGECGLWAS